MTKFCAMQIAAAQSQAFVVAQKLKLTPAADKVRARTESAKFKRTNINDNISGLTAS